MELERSRRMQILLTCQCQTITRRQHSPLSTPCCATACALRVAGGGAEKAVTADGHVRGKPGTAAVSAGWQNARWRYGSPRLLRARLRPVGIWRPG